LDDVHASSLVGVRQRGVLRRGDCPVLCRDSYWILKGLLVSQMNTTAENMCFNLLSLLETYGHIPNGVW
jgi:Trehalase